MKVLSDVLTLDPKPLVSVEIRLHRFCSSSDMAVEKLFGFPPRISKSEIDAEGFVLVVSVRF